MINRFLNSITMYRLMLYYLFCLLGCTIVFSVMGVLPYNPADIAVQAFVLVGVCWAVNKCMARLVRTSTNIESAFITALILSLILGPVSLSQGWKLLVIAGIAAMVSKYVLVRKQSHIFNPAAFGVVVSALLAGQFASWWVGSLPMAAPIIIGGFLITYKIRRAHLIGGFLLTYLILLVGGRMFGGMPLSDVASLLKSILSYSPLLFFVFVMLVEPLTAPQTRQGRIRFGIFVGAVLWILQNYVPQIIFSTEISLLLGNVFAFVLSPSFRQTLTLIRKEQLAGDIMGFWLEPIRPFHFQAGQFLEYTLDHPRPDNRGVRRYFSIASSPTEKQTLLASRFSTPGSTFKSALKGMKPGDSVIASQVAGEFILPENISQKLVLIAGGIGITPFRSMIKYLLDTNQSRDMILIYGARAESDFVFRDIFEQAKKKFSLKAIYTTDMINEGLIQATVSDIKERLFYVSGPEPMVQGVEKTLKDMGISRRNIRRDYFPGYKE